MDSLSDFENWLKENNLGLALLLTEKYRKEKNQPKEDLIKNCKWIKKYLNKLVGVEAISFTEEEIRDLYEKGYHYTIYLEIDKSKHYLYSCLDYDYYITVEVYKNEEKIVELSSQVDYDEFYSISRLFEENIEGKSKIYSKG